MSSGQPVDSDAGQPKVLTFEQFAARNGASRCDIGDAGLHRSSARKSEIGGVVPLRVL